LYQILNFEIFASKLEPHLINAFRKCDKEKNTLVYIIMEILNSTHKSIKFLAF